MKGGSLLFSGITQGLFLVEKIKQTPNQLTYWIRLSESFAQGLQVGASVSVNGVCQSVVSIAGLIVEFDAIEETLIRTTLKDLKEGEKVSLERSLKIGDEIGGHEMSGHIIGVGTIQEIWDNQDQRSLEIICPKEWMPYFFEKGFVGIDGSSLTLGKVDEDKQSFQIHLIPETLRVTDFANKKIGDKVNIEIDHKTKVIVDTTKAYLQKLK